MKLLLLRANPNKSGFTQLCVEKFLKGVGETQAQIEDVDLTNLDLKPCRGCFKCWTVTPGKCIQTDDMQALLEKFLGKSATSRPV
jgi:multimeric flavodoxin WrbA